MGCRGMIYRKLLLTLPIYGIFLILNPLYPVNASDAYYDRNERTNECWADGREDGANHPFDHDRNEECKNKGNQYYWAFIEACAAVEGNTRETCERFTDD
jgi:hypothetical protein